MAGDQVLNGAIAFIVHQFKPFNFELYEYIIVTINIMFKNNKNYKSYYKTPT